MSRDQSPHRPWALFVMAALFVITGGCGPALPPEQADGKSSKKPKGTNASPASEGVTRGFKYPEYDSQQRLKTMLTGAEARPQGEGLMRITGLRVETYDKDGAVEMIVEAPDCLFDRINRTARSPGELEARSANGMFRVTGRGFEWNQGTGRLVITNDSRTVISQKMIEQTNTAP